jgi:hypothetical protein
MFLSMADMLAALLQEALTLAPRLKERSKSDPELDAVGDQVAWAPSGLG